MSKQKLTPWFHWHVKPVRPCQRPEEGAEMKNCTDCKYADWRRTGAGRLHPSGDGRCLYEYEWPQLAASMRWLTLPVIAGGQINRRQDLPAHCVYFTRKEGT